MTNIYCWVATHVGHVREHNEDSFAVSVPAELSETGTWEGQLPGPHAWAVVADGMGGHAAGEVASRVAVEVLRMMLPGVRAKSDIIAALGSADWAIRDAMTQEPAIRGMGTTVCGVVAFGHRLAAFNSGDSRIYFLDAGGLRQLSEDHVVHGHMLTQCLGGSSRAPTVAPHLVTCRLQDDGRLLLCTDGVTDLLTDEQIEEVLRSSVQPAEELVEAALKAGGHDNATAIVLQLEAS